MAYPAPLQAIVTVLEGRAEHDSASLSRALQQPLNIDDIAPWIRFDVGNYARNLVARGANWELRLFCWRPGQSTSLHGHGASACCFRILRGNASETVLGQRDRVWAPGATVAETMPLVHQVSNGASDALLTMHAYSPALPVDQPSDPRGHSVVIVGGGFAGIAAAYHLLQDAAADLRVTVVERGPWLGRGVAYGVESNVFRLNVPASKMSIDPAKPNDFVEWADVGASPHQFLSRARYGAYVETRLAEVIRKSAGKIRITRADAVAVGDHVVRLSDGRELEANAVVLATGIEPRVVPSALPPDPRIIDAWDECALPTLPSAGHVLILGSGLSAIDVLCLLDKRGFKGEVTVLSRRGLLPRAHLEPFRPAAALRAGTVDGAPSSLRALVRWARELVDAQLGSDQPWQDAIDAMRPHVPRLWRGMSHGDRARFVRMVRPYWDAMRHRAPVDALELVRAWTDAKRLRVVAARILKCEPKPGGLEVAIRTREGDKRSERFDAIVRCIGPALEQSETRGPLVASLLETGLAARDPAGLGIVTSDDGSVVGKNGQPSGWLFALGALRRASAWETTAVPEIAQQARHVAGRINQRR